MTTMTLRQPATTLRELGTTLRELGPDDADVLDAVFAGLSPTSRYLRFHGGAPVLSPRTRAVLAAVDGRRHLAVAAFAGDAPVGIARLIAMDDGGRADLAVEVVDAWQGRGVGTRLVRAVLARGAAAGLTTVEADVLSTNAPMLHVLTGLLPGLTRRVDGPETHLTAPLNGEIMNSPIPSLVDQHRAALLAEARDRRLARAGRPARGRRPGRPLVTLIAGRPAPLAGGDAA